MPSARRSLRDGVRSHPVIVALSAASAGVLLGGFVAFQLLASPQPRVDSAAAQAPVAAKTEVASKTETAPEPKPPAETTGSAPAGERTASTDCDRETWPYLSPPCVEEMRSKHRTRVISTDKLDTATINALQAPSAAPPAEPKPAAPAVADTKPVSTPPVNRAAAPSPALAAPEQPAATATPPARVTSTAPPPRSKPSADTEAKKEKRIATKSNRKPKLETHAPARQESDDDDGETPVASSTSGSRVADDRSSRRVDRRRIVERWTERDYDVPAYTGDGGRRVTVIRRGGGGLFGDLFAD
jgi:hypothetical protein